MSDYDDYDITWQEWAFALGGVCCLLAIAWFVAGCP